MRGCQKYDPFLGTPNIRCRIMRGIQEVPSFGQAPIQGLHIPRIPEQDSDFRSFRNAFDYG